MSHLTLAMMTQNPAASGVLMYFVLGIVGLQTLIGVGCIAAAAWGPTRRWLAGFAGQR
jgi:hypothetical protein